MKSVKTNRNVDLFTIYNQVNNNKFQANSIILFDQHKMIGKIIHRLFFEKSLIPYHPKNVLSIELLMKTR